MPQHKWSDKRERQYQHIRSSQEDRGVGGERATEIAARTVNKNRAQSGEADEASPESLHDMSPQRRGGRRSGKPGPRGQTKAELYGEARRRGIKGRSKMTKRQLQNALAGRREVALGGICVRGDSESRGKGNPPWVV